MSRDLIIGLVVSLVVHFVALNPFAGKAPPPPKPKEAKEEVVQFEMPPLEEEKEEKVEDLDEQPQNQLAPPSLVDMPTVVPVDAFTQTLAPPPPPNLTANKGAITIPVTKPGANFGKGIKDLFDINN